MKSIASLSLIIIILSFSNCKKNDDPVVPAFSTINGGGSWKRESAGATGFVESVRCLTDNKVFFCVNGGVIIKGQK